MTLFFAISLRASCGLPDNRGRLQLALTAARDRARHPLLVQTRIYTIIRTYLMQEEHGSFFCNRPKGLLRFAGQSRALTAGPGRSERPGQTPALGANPNTHHYKGITHLLNDLNTLLSDFKPMRHELQKKNTSSALTASDVLIHDLSPLQHFLVKNG